jgi:hypothetical protein
MNRYLAATLVILLITVAATITMKGQCSDCPRPHIALFDCRVLVPEPTVTDSLSFVAWKNWVRLYLIAGALHEQLFEGDPKIPCVGYFDGSFAAQNTTDPDSLQAVVGVTWANLPPDGPLDGWGIDYLFVGEINSASGGYTLTLRLETGPTRELVKSVQVPFDSARGGYLAGIAAATLMIPVIDEIQKFEKDKRDSDTKYAVNAEITLAPAKLKVAANESVSVDVKLEDCDRREGKVPLKQRLMHFWAEGGSVDPPMVHTDDAGKARVTFIAGSNAGIGILHSTYPYHHPDGHTIVTSQEASIVIQQIPTGILFAQAIAWSTTTVHAETTTSAYMFRWDRKMHRTETQSMSVTAWIPNQSGDPNTYLGGVDNDAIAKTMHGIYSTVEFNRSADYVNGQLAQGKEHISYWDGSVTPDSGWVLFECAGDTGGISITVGFNGILATHTKTYRNPGWVEQGSASPFKDRIGSTGADDWVGGNGTVTHSGRMYYITGGTDTTYRTAGSEYGSVVTSVQEYIVGIVRPAEDVTAIEPQPSDLLPPRFVLSQNYPNPFNPGSTIQFDLPNASQVTLTVYDILGRNVETLVDGVRASGTHKVQFNPTNLPSGVYFYRIQARSLHPQKREVFMQTKKLVLLR